LTYKKVRLSQKQEIFYKNKINKELPHHKTQQ